MAAARQVGGGASVRGVVRREAPVAGGRLVLILVACGRA